MCGRYTIIHSADAVAERFGVAAPHYDPGPRYNVAPTQGVPIIVQDGGERALVQAHWGLVPFWAKDPAIGSRLINARAETLGDKASFKYALSRRRCLVPADGFYEWQRTREGAQPFYIRPPDGRLFAMAGLWEQWESPDGSPLLSCAIVTVEPNDVVRPIHSRMPAILAPNDEQRWLGGARAAGTGPGRAPAPEEQYTMLLRPSPNDLLEAYPVSRYVNSPANNSPACIARAA